MNLKRLLLLFAASAPALLAQTPPPPSIPGPPEPAPVAPGAALPAAAPGRPAADPDTLGNTLITEPIEELKLSGDALAGLYRKYTGRRVIVPSTAAAAEFRFVQDASEKDPLTYAEAAELLRKAAVLENFVFVEHPQDPNLDILTLATGGPRPTNVDINVFNEETPLPDQDVVITYVMTLSHIKADQAVNIFTQVLGQTGPYGSISAVPNASAVVITEKASLIKSLIDLQKTIDVPGSIQSTRFIKVQYADVTEIAETLSELLGAQEDSGGTAGVQRNPVSTAGNANPPGAQPAAGGGGGEATPVQIIPEPRTNRIFAMGRPVDLVFVEGLVREFDIPSSEKTFLRRKLRFLAVADFLPIAGDALTRAFSGNAEGGAAAGTSGSGTSSSSRGSSASRQSGRTAQSRSGFGSSGFSSNSGGSSGFGGAGGFGGGSGGFGGSGGGMGSALDTPEVNAAPESLLVGRTLLVADNITNSIVAQGPPSALEVVERLLDQIDVKADQVMISTVFGQLTLGDSINTGIDWLKVFNEHGDGSGVAGSILNSGRPTFDPARLTRFGTRTTDAEGNSSGIGFPGNSGLSLYGKIGSDLAAYVNLLQTSSDFTVLSRPSIFTANNQKGTISSGRRIAVPTNSYNYGGNVAGQSTNIEYRDVVLKLEVIPLVNSEKEITMQIALLSDDVIGESDEIAGLGKVPIIGTREILTTVTVPNNQTVVLGGLITENTTKSVTGIPVLSSIPGLGRLFSDNNDGTNRDELLVFIQPSIVRDGQSLNNLQTDTDVRYGVSTTARDFAENRKPRGGKLFEWPKPREDGQVPAAGMPRKTIRPAHRR